MTHHEPKCDTCGTFDADCDCTLRWGMGKDVYAGMGNHESLSETYTSEGVRLIEVQRLKDTMSFDHLADLYLTLTDGIVRERLLRRTAEHKLYAIKTMVNLLD